MGTTDRLGDGNDRKITDQEGILSIESEAKKDLALDPADAERLTGGQKKAKRAVARHHQTTAAVHSSAIVAAPVGSQPVPGGPGDPSLDDPGPDGC